MRAGGANERKAANRTKTRKNHNRQRDDDDDDDDEGTSNEGDTAVSFDGN